MRQEFKGTEAIIVEIGPLKFAKQNNKLWSLCSYEWKFEEGKSWMAASAGGYHDLGEGRMIDIKYRDAFFRVNKYGFEEVPVITRETMIREIAKKLDLLEYTGGYLYALQENEKIKLGCTTVVGILSDLGAITIVHNVKERTLYRFIWTEAVARSFKDCEKEIKEIYERMCK